MKPDQYCLILYRLTSNSLLLSPPTHSRPADSAVEWAYAFDVHTNAFFPFWLALYVAQVRMLTGPQSCRTDAVQLFLLPIVLKDIWICLWVGNTLYLAAFAQYTYGIYLGLNGACAVTAVLYRRSNQCSHSLAILNTVRATAFSASSLDRGVCGIPSRL